MAKPGLLPTLIEAAHGFVTAPPFAEQCVNLKAEGAPAATVKLADPVIAPCVAVSVVAGCVVELEVVADRSLRPLVERDAALACGAQPPLGGIGGRLVRFGLLSRAGECEALRSR